MYKWSFKRRKENEVGVIFEKVIVEKILELTKDFINLREVNVKKYIFRFIIGKLKNILEKEKI